MANKQKTKRLTLPEDGPGRKLLLPLAVLVLAALIIIFFGGSYKVLTLLACFAAFLIPVLRGRKPEWRQFITPLTLAVVLYLVYCAIGRTYALSGKFFLQEFSKLLFCLPLFLGVGLSVAGQKSNARKAAALFAGLSALYAVLSVEAASTGLMQSLLSRLGGYASLNLGFEAGTRMTGIFGNANILAGALAIGTFFSLALLESSETRGERIADTALLGVNAYGFLLAFSMGATAAFGAACVVYLIFAGSRRISILVRMVETAIVVVAAVFLAFPAFESGSPLPLVLLICVPVILYLLDRFLGDRVASALTSHGKASLVVILAVVLLAAAYLVAGLTVTGSYTFGQSITRSLYPAPGENAIEQATWNGEVKVRVRSQNSAQVMMHTDTTLYNGSIEHAVFTVPEDAVVVHFDLSGAEGAQLFAATLRGGEKLKLDYKLLPGFIANRLQGLRANQNAIQRTVFFKDGITLFGRSPIVGNGLGSFETAIFGVQSFYYETKYVHNHYIQVLLDGGILGAVLYLGMLALAVLALLRRRSLEALPERVRPLYPALCAGLLFLLIHSGVEVTMSTLVFLPFAAGLLALISALFSPPLTDRRKAVDRIAPPAARTATALLGGVFAVLIALNLYAYKSVTGNLSNLAGFYKALDTAVKVDAFESIDYHLSYVANANQSPENETLAQLAAPHAEKLAHTNSNATAPSVILYYTNRGDLLSAAQAADFALRYNRANPQSWATYLDLLCNATFREDQVYIYTDEAGPAYAEAVSGIADFLAETDRELLAPILLSDKLYGYLDLNEAVCRSEDYYTDAYRAVFDSDSARDFDGDGLPELCAVEGGTFDREKGFTLQPGGSITLTAVLPYGGTGYQISAESRDDLTFTAGEVTLETIREENRVWGGLTIESSGIVQLTISAPEGAEIHRITINRD